MEVETAIAQIENTFHNINDKKYNGYNVDRKLKTSREQREKNS